MRSWIRHVGVGCLALFALACGSKGDDDGTGGGAGTGGAAGSAGGGAGTGGSSGSVDAGGSGGTADSGAGPVDSGRVITQSYTFDTDVQTWKFQYASVPPGDAGIPLIPATEVMITQDATHGSPTPGALQVGIPYSSKSQYVGIGISYTTGVNLTGKIITAKVQLVSGLGTDTDLMTAPGGAKLYIKTGAGFAYAAGLFTNLPSHGNWIDLDFDMGNKSGWSYPDPGAGQDAIDITDVRELGIQFDTGGMAVTATPAVLLVDTVQY